MCQFIYLSLLLGVVSQPTNVFWMPNNIQGLWLVQETKDILNGHGPVLMADPVFLELPL